MKQKESRLKEHISPCLCCFSGATSSTASAQVKAPEESKTALTVPQLLGFKEQREQLSRDMGLNIHR